MMFRYATLLATLHSSLTLTFANVDLADLELAGKVTPAKTGGPDGKRGFNPCGCEERRVMIDFENFSRGEYVTTLQENALTVSVSGQGYAPNGGAARIFDSTNPSPDLDLGSPHETCNGLGRGGAGRLGARGENCRGEGNLLILQRVDKPTPDSAEEGAVFKFTMDDRVEYRLGSAGFLNVGGADTVNIVATNRFDGSKSASQFSGIGKNAYQEITLTNDIRYYSDVEIIFPTEGAISWLLFCRPIQSTSRLRRRRRTNEQQQQDHQDEMEEMMEA